jgi:hypothetical protein
MHKKHKEMDLFYRPYSLYRAFTMSLFLLQEDISCIKII